MKDWQKAAVQHAEAESPKESCGLLIALEDTEHYWPCNNLSDEDDLFVLDPIDYAAAEDIGEVLAVIHSHPGAPALPSQYDKRACTQYGLPWLIYGMADESWSRIEP